MALRFAVIGLVPFELTLPETSLPTRGTEIFVDTMPLSCGGALNVASVLGALGATTSLHYPSGSGLSDAAVARELAHFPDLLKCPIAADADPAISVICHPQTDRSFFSKCHFSELRHFNREDLFSEITPVAGSAEMRTWIHVPGLEEAYALREDLCSLRADARISGVSVSCSYSQPRFRDFKTWCPNLCDVIFMNELEMEHIFGSAEGLLDWMSEVQHPRPQECVVTRGKQGAAIFRTTQDVLHQPAEPVLPEDLVDTTGAGDALAGAYLFFRYSENLSQKEALGQATKRAAKSLSYRGGACRDPQYLRL